MGWSAQIRRRTGAFLVDNGFRIAARLGKLSPRANPSRHNVEVLRDIPYQRTGRREHLLDVYLPTNVDPPYPMVFYVHGGGFRILSKDSHWLFGLIFARRGYAVFNVNYRLAPKHRFPAAIEDVAAAYAWVSENHGVYGADGSRVVLAGESAGANLATSLAICDAFDRPEPYAQLVREAEMRPSVVVPMCGMMQVSHTWRYRAKKYPKIVRDRIEEVTEAYLGKRGNKPPAPEHALADPLLILEGDAEPTRPLPPFFLSVGAKDPLMDDTHRLEAALMQRGVRHEAHYYPDELHAFQAYVFREAALTNWRRTFEFLERELNRGRQEAA